MYWTGGRLQMLPHCQKLPTDAQEQREHVGGSLKVVNAFLEYCLKKTASQIADCLVNLVGRMKRQRMKRQRMNATGVMKKENDLNIT